MSILLPRVSSTWKNARISPQKARLVGDQIRGLKLEPALNWLKYTPKKAARFFEKVVLSLLANAENNNGLDADELYIKTVCVDEAPRLKRFQARAKGRGNRIIKRNSHIRIELASKN